MLAGNGSKMCPGVVWGVVLGALVVQANETRAESATPARFRSAPSVSFATPDPLTGRGVTTTAATFIAPVGEQRLAALAADALGSPAGLSHHDLPSAMALSRTISLQHAPKSTPAIAMAPEANSAVLAPTTLPSSAITRTAGFQFSFGVGPRSGKTSDATSDVVARSWTTGESSGSAANPALISLLSNGARTNWSMGFEQGGPAHTDLNGAPLLGGQVQSSGSKMGHTLPGTPSGLVSPAAMGAMIHASPR